MKHYKRQYLNDLHFTSYQCFQVMQIETSYHVWETLSEHCKSGKVEYILKREQSMKLLESNKEQDL